MIKIGCCDKILDELDDIEDLLEDKKFGLAEIKREVRDIEDKLDKAPTQKGALSTGPFFVRTGQNNAINVKVQNVGTKCVDVVVRLFDIGACPPEEIDSECLKDIGRCCAEDAVLTAPAGNFEVAICPDSPNATLRAFVSVHTGNSANSAFEYVIKAAEMLPLVCPFCKRDKCPCHKDPCHRDPCRECD